MKIQSLRGMHDLLPDQSTTWQYLEKTVADLLGRYSYKESAFPLLSKLSYLSALLGRQQISSKKRCIPLKTAMVIS